MDSFLQNIRVAIRVLRRRPGLTAAAVLTLALGIGVNAAMFGVVSKVVLAPLPFEKPDRVVQLWDLRQNQPRGVESQISLDNFRDYESRNNVFSHVAAMRPVDLYVERGGRGILRLRELDRGDFSAGMAELATAAADGVIPKLAIERLDGDPLIGSGLEETLIGVGFSRQPRKFVASA